MKQIQFSDEEISPGQALSGKGIPKFLYQQPRLVEVQKQ